MPALSKFEKCFINRWGPRAYRRMLDRTEGAGQLPLGPTAQVLELGAGERGFTIVFRERAWRIFNTADEVVAKAPATNPGGPAVI